MQYAGAVGVAIMLALAVWPLSGRDITSLEDGITCTDLSGDTCTCDPTAVAAGVDTPVEQRQESNAPILFLVAFACFARSLFHRSAGVALVHDSDDGPQRHIAMYTLIAVVHTPVMLVFLRTFGADWLTVITAGCALLAWPVALQLIVRSRRFAGALSQRRHASFEGVGVLLTTLGTISAALIVLGAGTLLQHTNMDGSGAMIAIAIIGALCVGRSAVQLITGARLAQPLSLRDALGTIRAYRRFSLATMLGVLATMTVYGFANWGIVAVAVAVVLTGALMAAWPGTLARLCDERAFEADMEQEEPLRYTAAPDSGLVSLGWLMLPVAAISLAFSAPAALSGDGNWWLVALAGMEMWAALELLSMSDRRHQVVMTTGLLGVAVVLFTLWPAASAVTELRAPAASGPEITVLAARHVFACCVHLGIAIAAILLSSKVGATSTITRVQLKRSR